LYKQHPEGPRAVQKLVDVLCEALKDSGDAAVKIDAADNLILFLHKIIKQSDDTIDQFYPVVCNAMNCISAQPEEIFRLFVRSFFSLRRLAEELSQLYGKDSVCDFAPSINSCCAACR
jgi:pyruvate,orthophosphate dikinase